MKFGVQLATLIGIVAAFDDELAAIPDVFTEDDECEGAQPGDERCDISMMQRRSFLKKFVEANQVNASDEGDDASFTSIQFNASDEGEDTKNIMTLYHQTTETAGHSILRTGFRLGKSGICGPAIYFSPSAKDTDVKAVGGRGFIIEAQVDMGRIKKMGAWCDEKMNGKKLKDMGYNSITLDRGYILECAFLPHCVEYIIYDNSRIIHMKGYKYNGFKSWFPR